MLLSHCMPILHLQGVDIWAHGLWSWDWADSHKPIKAIDLKSQKITVGIDAINRDVSPIRPATSSQGGHAYIYNSPSELDAPGEYFIDRENATLSFIAPSSPSGSGHACRWNVSISRSDQPGRSWKSLLVWNGPFGWSLHTPIFIHDQDVC